MVVSERSCVGVRDQGRDPEFLYGCKRPGEISRNLCVGVRDPGEIQNFCMGVRDPGRRPKFL